MPPCPRLRLLRSLCFHLDSKRDLQTLPLPPPEFLLPLKFDHDALRLETDLPSTKANQSINQLISNWAGTLRIASEITGEAIRASLMAAEMKMGPTAYAHVSQFLAAIFFFHGSEYALAVLLRGPVNVSLSSLLISKQYVIAMACALLEYWAELTLFPELKEHWWVSNIGLMMVLLGEVIRKSAIITAGRSFTHNIRVYFEEEHELITHGIYRFMRHPSYCGFFIWAVGTQLMLCNPICIIAFAAITWRFFSDRIQYEEFFLRQFFGPRYVEYAQQVPSGLPFIK